MIKVLRDLSPEPSISSVLGPAQILDKICVNPKDLWKYKVKDDDDMQKGKHKETMLIKLQ